ncbi:MAG: nitroreductase family protein [Anaerolineales bacterium]|nr:nitroreductase family protein [Anaerolineales bacterium]
MSSKTLLSLHTFLRSRRSIRKFNGQRIPEEILREILETATFAPSAHGLQPWRFVLVENQAARQSLALALTDKMQADMRRESAPEAEITARVKRSMKRISEAPHIILLCRDTEAVRIQSPEETLMGVQSVAMAGLQLMLAAHARGLGANWICWPLYAQAEVIRALHLPSTWQPQGMVFLGYPAEQAGEKALKPLDEVLLTIDGTTPLFYE